MQVSEIVSNLKRDVSLHSLFSHQTPLRFPGERIYLDETGFRKYEKFIYLLDFLESKIKKESNNDLVVCVRYFFDGDRARNTREIINDFNRFNIRHDGFITTELTEEPDKDRDDAYYTLHFSELETSQLKLLLWGHLAKHFNFLEECIGGEVYILSVTNYTLYHIYDDRGMDVVRWKGDFYRESE